MTAIHTVAEPPSLELSPTAFGSLIDLAILRFDAKSAEICDACNTINMGSARYCKCCSHKLAGFYISKGLGAEVAVARPPILPRRASELDFAAFCLIINFLILLTRFIPVP